MWEGTEPVRKVLETVLAPLDIVAADHWVGALKEIAEVPWEWLAQVGEKTEDIEKLKLAGQSRVDELIEAARFTEAAGGKIDAWWAFAPELAFQGGGRDRGDPRTLKYPERAGPRRRRGDHDQPPKSRGSGLGRPRSGILERWPDNG